MIYGRVYIWVQDLVRWTRMENIWKRKAKELLGYCFRMICGWLGLLCLDYWLVDFRSIRIMIRIISRNLHPNVIPNINLLTITTKPVTASNAPTTLLVYLPSTSNPSRSQVNSNI